MSRLKALVKRILRPMVQPWLEAIATRVAPKLGRGHLSVEADRIQLTLRVMAALRSLAQAGDHYVVLPHDSVRVARNPKEIRIGFFGNIANNAYNFTRCLRRLGYDAELVLEDGYLDTFPMNRPFWEDLEVECGTYEEGLTHEPRWTQPEFVRRVAFAPDMQARFQGRLTAVPEVQALYKDTFGKDLSADRALVLAQHMGHWPYLLAMKRYHVVQFSGAPIGLGPFCPHPYVVFPTGSDLFISPFEETVLGLRMRTGYRQASHLMVCETNYFEYLDRLELRAPRSFAPLMIDTDTYGPGSAADVRARWIRQVGGERFVLSVCRQSWEWKGNDRLVRAFAAFVKEPRHGEWRLVLTQWGPDVEQTKRLIADLGAGERVCWEPLASKPVVRKRQQAADLVADQFVMPGYGTSVLESLAAGRLVMMRPTDSEGLRYLGEAPPFLGAATLEEIRAGLEAACDDRVRKKRESESVEWVRKRHGYVCVNGIYMEAYESALRRAGGTGP